MLFPTFGFALFFFVVFFLYWYVFRIERHRCFLLTGASYVFYAFWDWRFCFLLFIISLTAGTAGYVLGRQKDYIPRKITLITAAVLHITVLAFFKYFYDATLFIEYTFFHTTDLPPLAESVRQYSLVIPAGISYYTFRALSYIFDIYLCKMRPKPLADLLLYISFFPQLLSGPIVQAEPFFTALPKNLSCGIKEVRNSIDFDKSLLLILSGLYKKMILAQFLSELAVDPVFSNPVQCSTVELLTALLSYTFVIYCDFSGYSDMAVGIALLLGFDSPKNFNRPYTAQSVSEFWRRWHISLSEWLRAYVYFSFGGSRYGLVRTVCALMGTMLIAGIWHGSRLTFLLWGGMQGAACAVERIITVRKKERRMQRGSAAPVDRPAVSVCIRCIRVLGVFIFVNISWLVFRSGSFEEVRLFVSSLGNISVPAQTVHPFTGYVLAAAFLLQVPGDRLREQAFHWYVRMPVAVKISVSVLFFIGLNSVSMSGISPFIYFGF